MPDFPLQEQLAKAEQERDEAQRRAANNYEKACEWRDELIEAESQLAEARERIQALEEALRKTLDAAEVLFSYVEEATDDWPEWKELEAARAVLQAGTRKGER